MSVNMGQSDPTNHLHREFKPRHVPMIAVAGAIGTGLIIGSGAGLVRGSPASLLIAYNVIGAVMYFIMTAIGEMATMLPMDKGFAGLLHVLSIRTSGRSSRLRKYFWRASHA